jgi:hypothetical protein
LQQGVAHSQNHTNAAAASLQHKTMRSLHPATTLQNFLQTLHIKSARPQIIKSLQGPVEALA